MHTLVAIALLLIMGGNGEMSILEKEVWVNASSKMIDYYEKLGYEISRKINKWGKLTVPKGSKILIKVEDLPDGSNIKLTKVCDECGISTQNQKYNSILKSRKNGDGKDRCCKCILNERSLEHYAIESNLLYLLEEYSDKNVKPPSSVYKGSGDYVWWDCPKCKNTYDMKLCDRTGASKNNCPYCSGYRVNQTNCLWTTHPGIAKFLSNEDVGYSVTHGCNKEYEFTCIDCNHKKHLRICTAVRYGFSCPRCSDGISYPEKFMMYILTQLDINYENQKTFEWSKNIKHDNKKLNGNKKYDFYIPTKNLIIETHGKQHYEESSQFEKTLEEEQENDRLKEDLARQNGIKDKYYIAIDCRNSNLKFIKDSIVNSEINNLFDLSQIDWLKCHEFACNSLVKEVANLWNKGIKSSYKIADILKLDRSTISKNYLKQAVELGWCDYNPKEQMKQSQYNNSKKIRKKVIQLTLSGDYVKEWESAREIHKELDICYKKISSVCNGKMKSTGNFKWVFKDDYEEYIETGRIPLHKNRKEVICLNTLQVYKTITEAGRAIGRAQQNIKSHILGKTNSCGIDEVTGEPLKWMYKDDYDKHIKEQNKELILK